MKQADIRFKTNRLHSHGTCTGRTGLTFTSVAEHYLSESKIALIEGKHASMHEVLNI